METLQADMARLREENLELRGKLNSVGNAMDQIREAAMSQFPDFVNAMKWKPLNFSFDLTPVSATGSDSRASSAGSPSRATGHKGASGTSP